MLRLLLSLTFLLAACAPKAPPDRPPRPPMTCPSGDIAECPGFGVSNECIDSDDCEGGEECYGPDQENFGYPRDNSCMPPAKGCNDDQVCRLAADAIEGDPGQCVPDCRKQGCDDGYRCHRRKGYCLPIPCNRDGGRCPEHFECIVESDGAACERSQCASDDDCPSGACWEGSCFPHGSVCEHPAA